ncbi:MAG TPA: SPOR domain-containing protein, partial [Bacteroidales bacterium]|nr:SPOR domain-containing protein [Bacteroidales bacterium]
MHDFVRRIEHLLTEHDCVIVPGLGGFVQNETEAHFDCKDQLFYPPSKQIGFNARLHFNDGLLAQSYQQDYDIDFEEAMDRIKDRVQELKGYLSQGKYLTLGRIGYMHRSEEGQIVFRPGKNNPFVPSAYGLRPLYCNVIAQKTAPERTHDLGRWLVAVAACLLLMLLLNPVQHRLNNKNPVLQEASVLSACSLLNEPAANIPVKDSTTPVGSVTKLTEAGEVVEDVEIAETAKVAETAGLAQVAGLAETAGLAQVADAVGVAEVSKVSEPAEVFPSPFTPKYCIVVASFTNEADAQRWLEQKQLKKEYPQAGLVSKEGRTRVYVLGFDQREAALSYLAKFRAGNQKYAKSWVL